MITMEYTFFSKLLQFSDLINPQISICCLTDDTPKSLFVKQETFDDDGMAWYASERVNNSNTIGTYK